MSFKLYVQTPTYWFALGDYQRPLFSIGNGHYTSDTANVTLYFL